MDFSLICRTCMKNNNKNNLSPIFVSEDTRDRFSEAIFSCTGVQVKFNDGLPQNMCTLCMNQFNSTLKFRKQCKYAEIQLLKIKTELESKSTTIVTNEQLIIKITDNSSVLRNKLTTENKTDLNCSNVMKIKLESKNANIKTEPTEIDLDNDQYSIYKNVDSISLSKSNDLKTYCNDDDDINTETDDIGYLNEETIIFKNENNFKIGENFTQNIKEINNKKQFKCVVYSQGLQKNNDKELKLTETFLSDTEDLNNESNLLDLLSDTNVTELKKNTGDIPYIITDVTKKTTRVICKLCQKELSIRSIDSHMVRRHPGADERKVKCELCDKYVMREKLNRHRFLMHGNVGARCGYCKSEFNSKELLVDHVTTCTAKRRKRKVNDSGRAMAECDICKMTMQRASLNKHKAVKHAGLRPVCEHCGKSFGNKFRLNEHYRAKHGYEKFQCSTCDFQSAGIMAMRNHERRHRGEKPFVCEACGAKFHAAYLLMQHKHSHRTEKLVKCNLCDASFKANNNLHMHKLTCHSKWYYSCTVCARYYKCRYYALKHVRLAHNLTEPGNVVKLMDQ